jgi:flagellar biosynthetic protein FlhB
MAEDTAQERTEKATAKRLRDAREEGQVPRSRELTTMAVLLAASGGLLLLGPGLIANLSRLFQRDLTITKGQMFDNTAIATALRDTVTNTLQLMAPFFVVVVIVALLAPMALGGVTFSGKAVSIKWDRLNPVQGLKKLFGPRGLMELLKALAKFAVVVIVSVLVLKHWSGQLMALGMQPVRPALAQSMSLLGWSFVLISGAMVFIAAVDVPFQLWDFSRQLRMTRQELRDEYKETDGRPEVKGRIRRMQREYSRRRMMAEVPKADVVVVNPQHFAVALRYDQESMGAPVVVAKGADYIALQIRSIARSHQIPILSAPALARAIYYSTELNKEIPAGLYVAVAKVLAYVYQLRRKHRVDDDAPLTMKEDLPIPDELRRDD